MEKTSPVNYHVAPLQGRRKSYIVHVERLKRYNAREHDPLLALLPEEDWSVDQSDSQDGLGLDILYAGEMTTDKTIGGTNDLSFKYHCGVDGKLIRVVFRDFELY